ncbi:MAG: hypothetical protein AAFQ36_08975 [Pseudomonadota bacterium]
MGTNLPYDLEAETNQQIGALFSSALSTPITDGEHFSPGVWMLFDPEGSQTAKVESSEHGPVTLSVETQKPGGWMGLHIALGGLDLSNVGSFGLVFRSRAPKAMSIQPCLRSGTDDGFSDAFFSKAIVAHKASGTHLDCLELATAPRVPAQAPWRDLVFFFQPGSFSLELHSLKIFTA